MAGLHIQVTWETSNTYPYPAPTGAGWNWILGVGRLRYWLDFQSPCGVSQVWPGLSFLGPRSYPSGPLLGKIPTLSVASESWGVCLRGTLTQ